MLAKQFCSPEEKNVDTLVIGVIYTYKEVPTHDSQLDSQLSFFFGVFFSEKYARCYVVRCLCAWKKRCEDLVQEMYGGLGKPNTECAFEEF